MRHNWIIQSLTFSVCCLHWVSVSLSDIYCPPESPVLTTKLWAFLALCWKPGANTGTLLQLAQVIMCKNEPLSGTDSFAHCDIIKGQLRERSLLTVASLPDNGHYQRLGGSRRTTELTYRKCYWSVSWCTLSAPGTFHRSGVGWFWGSLALGDLHCRTVLTAATQGNQIVAHMTKNITVYFFWTVSKTALPALRISGRYISLLCWAESQAILKT